MKSRSTKEYEMFEMHDDESVMMMMFCVCGSQVKK